MRDERLSENAKSAEKEKEGDEETSGLPSEASDLVTPRPKGGWLVNAVNVRLRALTRLFKLLNHN